MAWLPSVYCCRENILFKNRLNYFQMDPHLFSIKITGAPRGPPSGIGVSFGLVLSCTSEVLNHRPAGEIQPLMPCCLACVAPLWFYGEPCGL